ncbi:MAG: CPBP family intramembrane metalloprotease [Deltaproteobacteria bacterium]|nr:CPBP family intramembrane metalloprotease [Deltaproteobacteria bacterium]
MENPAPPSPLTPAAFAYTGACAISLVLLGRLAEPLRVYGAAHGGALLGGRDPVQGLLWGIAAGAAAAALGEAVSRWTSWGRLFSRLMEKLLGTVHPADALLLALLSGFGEELLFRGLALPYLGLYASSALFGLAHVIPRRGLWPLALWAGANGLALGWLAQATGGLLAPTAAHVLVNAAGLLQLARAPRRGAE